MLLQHMGRATYIYALMYASHHIDDHTHVVRVARKRCTTGQAGEREWGLCSLTSPGPLDRLLSLLMVPSN